MKMYFYTTTNGIDTVTFWLWGQMLWCLPRALPWVSAGGHLHSSCIGWWSARVELGASTEKHRLLPVEPPPCPNFLLFLISTGLVKRDWLAFIDWKEALMEKGGEPQLNMTKAKHVTENSSIVKTFNVCCLNYIYIYTYTYISFYYILS